MAFSGVIFLFYFLPIFLAIYYLAPKRHRNTVLFLGSIFFYAWGEPICVVLLLLSVIFNFVLGLSIEKKEQPKQKKAILAFSVFVNLAVMVVFKYANSFLTVASSVLPPQIRELDLVIPIGISFYTFQAMSYIIDVYRGKTVAQKNFINLGTYIAMFPLLIAGPIVRYSTIEEQILRRRETIERFSSGIICFTVGLAKKVIIANNIGVLCDTICGTAFSELSAFSAWLGVIAFAFRIYFEFSGYADMAVGLGSMLGFEINKNFDYPYISKSITEFCQKWNISLGIWFKEYVYVPLNQSNKKSIRTYVSIFIIGILIGSWYGVGLNFVVWGMYYAILLVLEKSILSNVLKKLPNVVRVVYTLFLVSLGWVLFMTNDLSQCIEYLKVMFDVSGAGVITPLFFYDLKSNAILLVIALIASLPFGAKLGRLYFKKNPTYAIIPIAIILIMCIAYLVDFSSNPFLYFLL